MHCLLRRLQLRYSTRMRNLSRSVSYLALFVALSRAAWGQTPGVGPYGPQPAGLCPTCDASKTTIINTTFPTATALGTAIDAINTSSLAALALSQSALQSTGGTLTGPLWLSNINVSATSFAGVNASSQVIGLGVGSTMVIGAGNIVNTNHSGSGTVMLSAGNATTLTAGDGLVINASGDILDAGTLATAFGNVLDAGVANGSVASLVGVNTAGTGKLLNYTLGGNLGYSGNSSASPTLSVLTPTSSPGLATSSTGSFVALPASAFVQNPLKTSGRYYASAWDEISTKCTLTTTGQINYYPYYIPDSTFKTTTMAVSISTAGTGSIVDLGIYADTGSNAPGTLLVDAGTISLTSTLSLTTSTFATLSLSGTLQANNLKGPVGLIWIAEEVVAAGTTNAVGYCENQPTISNGYFHTFVATNVLGSITANGLFTSGAIGDVCSLTGTTALASTACSGGSLTTTNNNSILTVALLGVTGGVQ